MRVIQFVLPVLLSACAAMPQAPQELYAINRAVSGLGDCKDHVRAVESLSGYPTMALVTCDSGQDACHASAVVATPGGRFVVDNGQLGTSAHILSYEEFLGWVRVRRHIRYGVFPVSILDHARS